MTEQERKRLKKSAAKYRRREGAARRKAASARDKLKGLSGRPAARALVRAERAERAANRFAAGARVRENRACKKSSGAEWIRARARERRCVLCGALAAVLKLFTRENPLLRENARLEKDGTTLINRGAVYTERGGPMRRFTDGEGGEWLFLEAATPIGTSEPAGALAAEAAFSLQKLIDPDTAVRVFIHRDGKGKILGWFRERIAEKGAIDLFEWQSETAMPLPDRVKTGVLREHIVDWLLCNCAVDGRSFVVDKAGRLRGTGKERAFSRLGRPGTERMETFSNPDRSLYDTVFGLYAKGDPQMDLDLRAVTPYIVKLEQTDTRSYLALFERLIEAKCGRNARRAARTAQAIGHRKESLREEYRRFFTRLASERGKTGLLNDQGVFLFSDEL